ncbi:hypothetical protein BDR26DRAFT_399420 [Obelidium mucronatum]|nr:hypothetical protein BDR26DRAFT_399420 [Obelidium mucronatum]
MSTQILPEKDQVAVCLEMATTQSTLQEIFCLSSLQLAQKFHAAQREKMFELENSENAEEPNNSVINPGDEPYKNLDFRMGRMIANSYIYIYPILIDLLMKATLSSGLFLSDRMKEKTLQAASITILVSFPFIGALMNSFGRTMSFYFYQMSLTVMIIAVSHRLVASISFLIFTGLLVAACIYICIAQDLVLMVMDFT